MNNQKCKALHDRYLTCKVLASEAEKIKNVLLEYVPFGTSGAKNLRLWPSFVPPFLGT